MPEIIEQYAPLALLIAACFAIAAIGARVTTPQIPTWYAQLKKPPFNPPRWVFPVVWPILYLALAVAGWRVMKAPSSPIQHLAVATYAAQLALNAMWSPVFFGCRKIFDALCIVTALLGFTAVVTWSAYAIDRPAGILLTPYLLWIAFATCLNFAIWRLNDSARS